MAQRDPYEVLGVAKTASDAEIKSAYKKAAIKYHPDRQTGKSEAEKKEAEEKFKEAAEAYDILRDPDKRARYDQYGFAGMGGAGGFGGGAGFDINDILNSVFGSGFNFGGFSGGGGFEDFFGGGGRSRGPQQHQGGDLRLKVRLTLEEVSKGCTKKFKVKKNVTCQHCHGSGSEDGKTDTCGTCHGSGYVVRTMKTMFGAMQQQSVCSNCGGTGRVIKHKCSHCQGTGVVMGEEVVEVQIPAGVQDGMVLTVQGKGHAGRNNGISGDIQVYIEIEPHAELHRNGDDLYYNLLLDLPTAMLGGPAEIPTIDGRVKIRIEPGTQPGKIVRLRGKGLPALRGYGNGYGDLIVNISVYIPENLTKDERETLEKMRDSESFKPSVQTKQTFFQKFKNLFN